MGLHLELDGKAKRHWNGYVSHFAYLGSATAPDGKESFARYEAVMVPWLWFLSRRYDCRIFQDKSVPDIVKEVAERLPGRGARAAADRDLCAAGLLRAVPRERPRLRQPPARGRGHLPTSSSTRPTSTRGPGRRAERLPPVPGYGEIPYYPPRPPGPARARPRRRAGAWRAWCDAGRYDAPELRLREAAHRPRPPTIAEPQPHAQVEPSRSTTIPGDYLDLGGATSSPGCGWRQTQADHRSAHGEATARGLAPGDSSSSTNHPRHDQNIDYLLSRSTHDARERPEYRSADAERERRALSLPLRGAGRVGPVPPAAAHAAADRARAADGDGHRARRARRSGPTSTAG